jgi:hypothetical protein
MEGEPRLENAQRGGIDAPFIEQVSKIKVSLNSKQDPQWEVSIVQGATADEIAELHALAVAEHRALQRDLLGIQNN